MYHKIYVQATYLGLDRLASFIKGQKYTGAVTQYLTVQEYESKDFGGKQCQGNEQVTTQTKVVAIRKLSCPCGEGHMPKHCSFSSFNDGAGGPVYEEYVHSRIVVTTKSHTISYWMMQE